MSFCSLAFIFFLPIVFLLYWQVFRFRRWQNGLVVVASYVFYGWWDWRFLGLIAFTSLLSYAGGLLTEHYNGQRRLQRAVCTVCIIVTLLLLGIFKYFSFFADSFCALIGCQAGWSELNVVLPVGISFYTFQALSYTIDVYRGQVRASRDAVEFFAYISFFPQLVAGPIERASHLLPQFRQERRFCYADAVDGCRQMLWGFFKKMVVADNCATVVNAVWTDYDSRPSVMLMAGAVLFAFQIYCDFSGYSDIAIGCARLFGIHLKRNFNYPYFSRSMADFWRRWHISLTTWLRDYIYIPLGGSRNGHTLRNIFVVWCMSGLWHGANWTFVCWGVYHALLLAVGRRVRIKSAGRLLSVSVTFLFVVIGWVIFRAPTLNDAVSYLSRMLNLSELNVGPLLPQLMAMQSASVTAVVGIALMTVGEWRSRHNEHALQSLDHGLLGRYSSLRFAFYIVMAMLTIAFAGSQSEFIYFQF
ncbi:MAG: MBOAT family protein [Prevotella sp.]|nr:MBOAT family protein [Prevotella sp.]